MMSPELMTEIEKRTHISNKTLDKISEIIPGGWLHLNNKEDLGLIYMSPRMEKDFQATTEEVLKIGVKFLYDRIHIESSSRVVPKLLELIQSNDYNMVTSFFQYIRLPDKDYQWFITNTKLFVPRNCLISFTNPLGCLQDFDKGIADILDDNVYIRNHIEAYSQISKREKEIIRLLVKGNTLKEIAQHLNISELTIKTHRQNIYRKLNISSITELFRFATAFLLRE